MKVEHLKNLIKKSKFINEIDLEYLKKKCSSASPYPHICIDGMWKDEFLNKVAIEVENMRYWAGEKLFFGSKKKKWQNNWEDFSDNTNTFLSFLNQSLIIKIIEFITNEKGLISDPYLEGGGVHSTGNEGFLKLHIDFNWNDQLKLQRRINILVYLNKNWKKEYGGQIELAFKNKSGILENIVSLDPIFNRTLIFVTDSNSYHGQPNPVNHPFDKRRNSIAAYYYRSPTEDDILYESKRSETTYVDKSGKPINNSVLKKFLKKFI